MRSTIRAYDPQDEDAIVALSLRAWAPVFASLDRELGRDLFVRAVVTADGRSPAEERIINSTAGGGGG